jgi:microcystin-dependent protein
MSTEPFLGEIMIWTGNYAPRNWAFCNGQLMPIQQNCALFSILGTTYGGNGTYTFALPDFRGRIPVGAGQGPGLTGRYLGDMDGREMAPLGYTSAKPAAAGTGTVAIAPPIRTEPPFQALSFIIALSGIWPTRNWDD